MSKLATIAITLLVLLILAFGAYNFYLNYEYKEKVTHTGLKGEARKNPFYASRLFLKRMGIPTTTQTSVQGLSQLPDTNTVILITTSRTTLSRERTNKIIDWVKSGGHLIAKATRNWSYNGKESNSPFDDNNDKNKDKKGYKISPDPLQRYMGVHTTSWAPRDYDVTDEDSDQTNDDEVKSIQLNQTGKPLKLDYFRYRPIVVDKSHKNSTTEIKLGIHNFIVQQKIGKGMVTLVSDMGFLKNNDIENHDHAEILWQLIHGLHKPLSQPDSVWLIHNDKMPPLWDIMWRNYWAFIISLLLLLIFWLFKQSQRFGPLIPKQEEDRRSLGEHISSSGFFYWKNNNKQKLIDASRKALVKRLTQVFPGWMQLDTKQQIEELANHLSMQPEAIQTLLYSEGIDQADDFTQLIKQLETIRKTI